MWTDTGVTLPSYNYDIVALVGRFAPVHKGHLEIIRRALKESYYVVVMVGVRRYNRQLGEERNNAFLYEERALLLQAAMNDDPGIDPSRVIVMPLSDVPESDEEWVRGVWRNIGYVKAMLNLAHEPKVAFIGHNKDESSYYLKYFKEYGYIEVENFNGFSSTAIRKAMLRGEEELRTVQHMVTPSVFGWLNNYMTEEVK